MGFYRIAALCLVMHTLISFMIKGIVVARAAHHRYDSSSLDTADTKGWLTWAALTLFFTAGSWLVAQLVPFFEDLMDLLGATIVPLACWFCPVALYLWHIAPLSKTATLIGRF